MEFCLVMGNHFIASSTYLMYWDTDRVFRYFSDIDSYVYVCMHNVHTYGNTHRYKITDKIALVNFLHFRSVGKKKQFKMSYQLYTFPLNNSYEVVLFKTVFIIIFTMNFFSFPFLLILKLIFWVKYKTSWMKYKAQISLRVWMNSGLLKSRPWIFKLSGAAFARALTESTSTWFATLYSLWQAEDTQLLKLPSKSQLLARGQLINTLEVF